MAKRTDIKKVLIIGSGPIIIGQAAEFDYAGTQACLALKEEGYEVILCNSNPATIMTDTSIADKVYMEPLTLEYVAKILRYERPDAIVPGIGGQTGLNLAMQLEKKGILKEFKLSPVHQVLIEKSVKGYKEIEFEVMRDSNDRAITICGMENIDPVGVHTGDSAVVAPILSLNDHDLKMLNDSAIKIIRELKIEGGCNVQFALNPYSSGALTISLQNSRVFRLISLQMRQTPWVLK